MLRLIYIYGECCNEIIIMQFVEIIEKGNNVFSESAKILELIKESIQFISSESDKMTMGPYSFASTNEPTGNLTNLSNITGNPMLYSNIVNSGN